MSGSMFVEDKMFLNFTGFNKRERHELTEAVEFFAAQLMDPRMVRNLTLDIERNRKLDVQGECVSEEDCKNPRWFTITLRGGKDDEDMVKTLAHEMVHVKQYAKNELSKVMTAARGGRGIRIASKWQGQIWDPKKKEDPYWDCPWEIEAYGREVGLYQRWFAMKDKNNGN